MQNQKGNTNVIISFIIVLALVGLIVYALMSKTDAEPEVITEQSINTETSNQATSEKTLQDKSEPKKPMETNNKVLSNFTPISSVPTLQKIDTVVGTGAEVQAGATVSVHYTGAVAATGAIFQSSKDFGPNPVTFPLSGVIKGWTDGIPGMKIGGTRRLVIPAAMAYGATPPPGSGIPANADLVFDVELIAIK